MVEIKFLYQFLYFKTMHRTRIKPPSFPPFQIGFYSVLIVSGEFQHGWVVGARGRQGGGFKFLKREV